MRASRSSRTRIRAHVLQLTQPSGWPTIPQLFINGEFVGGADITKDMYQSGELTDMLVKAGLQPESSKP